MARLSGSSGAHALLLLLVVLLATCAAPSASAARAEPSGQYLWGDGGGRERKVGARTEVRDVEGNREVQELGRYSVDEHNRRREDDGRLEFGRVVSAQRQVVSGLKYYLRVAAAELPQQQQEEGINNNNKAVEGERVFDAVVVVKPWLDSRALLRFAPAHAE
ncbi:cysteine proteinase inhibitor 4 [Brachypodium distachyon]|uniref:Cystatin domain-containing protein n=1 Tax=Brachypodium distachyon TaxID=15368 RepID=I1HUJ0_BRADI|nr:cysteine proteinase inhibitor 4 [Brachypodium distachyon]KQK11176.1 hypothetical protein BRADI_2g58610v3 [Brachypodium distachyon]|eukprot:XP_003564913.1 cysteine proteinase inhibitor 4 [Brachypodium distachyon]